MKLTEEMLKLIPDVIPFRICRRCVSDAMRNSRAGTIRRLRRLGRIGSLWIGLVSGGGTTAIRERGLDVERAGRASRVGFVAGKENLQFVCFCGRLYTTWWIGVSSRRTFASSPIQPRDTG